MTSSSEFHNEPLHIDRFVLFRALKTLAEMVRDNGFDISNYDFLKWALDGTSDSKSKYNDFMEDIKQKQWKQRSEVKPIKKKKKKDDDDEDQETKNEGQETLEKLWQFFDKDLHMILPGKQVNCLVLFSLRKSIDADAARSLQNFVKFILKVDIIVISHDGFTNYAINNFSLPMVRRFTFLELMRNPTKHRDYSCPHILLDEKETMEKLADFNTTDLTQFSRLRLTDPQTLYHNFPKHSLVKILHYYGEPPIRSTY